AQKAAGNLQQGRLAGTGRALQQDDFPGVHAQAQSIEHPQDAGRFAEVFLHDGQLENGFGRAHARKASAGAILERLRSDVHPAASEQAPMNPTPRSAIVGVSTTEMVVFDSSTNVRPTPAIASKLPRAKTTPIC